MAHTRLREVSGQEDNNETSSDELCEQAAHAFDRY